MDCAATQTATRFTFFYTLYQPDKGISFLIRVETPVDGTDEVEAACQAAAEAVLDTFTLLE